MSVALSFCPNLAACPAQARHLRQPAARSSTLLAAATALAVAAAAIAHPPAAPLVPNTAYAAATLVGGQSTPPAALLAAAETMRARLLSMSGVGSVDLRGLQPGGLEVDYGPARLARFGLTAADLRAALPVQVGLSAPGRLTVRQSAVQSGLQSVADTKVSVRGRVFRLGDVATVARDALADPVSTMQLDGGVAVELIVTPASGADGSLERQVAAGLAQVALPGDVRLR